MRYTTVTGACCSLCLQLLAHPSELDCQLRHTDNSIVDDSAVRPAVASHGPEALQLRDPDLLQVRSPAQVTITCCTLPVGFSGVSVSPKKLSAFGALCVEHESSPTRRALQTVENNS
jgi:hypothetical protein